MPALDTKQREKWPAPRPYPHPEETAGELEQAQAEVASDPLRAKARAVLALLRQEYGEPRWPILDPLSALIEVLLSHRTADPQTWAAYKALRERFPTWEAVRDAPVAEIEAAIAGTTWPEQKAPRLQAVLQAISDQYGTLNLDFLATMDLAAAKDWLTSL